MSDRTGGPPKTGNTSSIRGRQIAFENAIIRNNYGADNSLPAGFSPSDITNLVHLWDMEGTITTSAGDVTQINDLIGTEHLAGTSDPAYESSNATLGGRKTAAFVRSSGEFLENGSVSQSQVFTVWMIFYHSGLSADDTPWADVSGNPAVYMLSALSGWTLIYGGTAETTTTTTPATDTPYLIIWEVNSSSSACWVNDTSQAGFAGNTGTMDLTGFVLGGDGTYFCDIKFTIGGILSSAMTSGDKADLWTWAQDNCGC